MQLFSLSIVEVSPEEIKILKALLSHRRQVQSSEPQQKICPLYQGRRHSGRAGGQ